MAKTAYQGFTQDSAGNAVASATVTVRNESDGSLATIYSDKTGSSKTNPFTAGADGYFVFYVDGGTYQVESTDGTTTVQYDDVALGNASATDTGTGSANTLTRADADTLYNPLVLNNYAATGAPTVTDDSDAGYAVGSMWVDISSSPREAYKCLDATVGAAVWVNTTLSLSELGTAALLDAGTGSGQVRTNTQNEAQFAPKAITVTTKGGTTHTLTAADSCQMLKFTSSSSITVTLPEDSTEALAAGFQVAVQMGGTGTISFVTEGTDTLASADGVTTITTQYAIATIVKQASGDWWLAGGLIPPIADGSSVGDVPVWDGSQYAAGKGLADLGWVLIVDDTYSSGSPLSITASTITQADITSGGSSVDTYAPRGIVAEGTGGWWNDTGNIFEPTTTGDVYMVNFSCTADASAGTSNIVLLDIVTDSTASPITTQAKTQLGFTDSTNPTQMSVTIPIHADTDAMANGVKFYITTELNTDFYDFKVLITKVADGAP